MNFDQFEVNVFGIKFFPVKINRKNELLIRTKNFQKKKFSIQLIEENAVKMLCLLSNVTSCWFRITLNC